MPLITSGLYQIVLEQQMDGQVLLNRFWYENTLGLDDLQDICAAAFDLDVLPGLSLIQSDTLSYVSITCKNVTGSLADFVRVPVTTVGTLTGQPIATFNAAGYSLIRTTKETRNGSKRFAGQTEIEASGQIWSAAFFTVLAGFSGVLLGDITEPGGTFDPVIGRFNPLTPTLWTANPIANVSASINITSQVSRKRGVGA